MSGERINFLLGCVPSWPEHAQTTFSAGSEVAGSEVENLATQDMAESWRTETLKPFKTWFEVHYGALEERPARCGFVGNLNLPEFGSWVRLRRRLELGDWHHRVWPKVNQEGEGDAFLEAINTTGKPSQLKHWWSELGIWDAGATPTYVEPTDGSSMRFRVRMDRCPGGVTAGPRLGMIRVVCAPLGNPAAAPHIRVKLYEAGVDQGLEAVQVGWPAGETDNWVLDLPFDFADLDDPTGTDLEVRVRVDDFGGGSAKIGSVVLLVKPLAFRPRGLPTPTPTHTFQASSNVGGGATPFDVSIDVDALRPELWTSGFSQDGIQAAVAGTPLDFRLRFADPRVVDLNHFFELDDTGGAQLLMAGVRRDGVSGAPVARLELWINGVATGLFDEATLDDDEDHILLIRWDAADLGAGTADQVEARVLGTPNGGVNIDVRAVGWLPQLDAPALDFDSGWIQMFPDVDNAFEQGDLDLVGKPVFHNVVLIYTDSAGVGVEAVGPHTRVDFYLDPQPFEPLAAEDPWQFFDERTQENVRYLEVARFAEGPAMTGMNLADAFSIEVVDPSLIEENDIGIIFSDDESTYRIFNLKLTNLPKDVAVGSLVDYLMRRQGHTRDVLLVVFPEDADFRRVAHCWGPLRSTKLDHDVGTIFRADLRVRERL